MQPNLCAKMNDTATLAPFVLYKCTSVEPFKCINEKKTKQTV